MVSVNPGMLDKFKEALNGHPLEKLGEVTSEFINVNHENWGSVASWKDLYDQSISKHMNKYMPE